MALTIFWSAEAEGAVFWGKKHNCLEPDGPLSELYAFQALYEQEAGSERLQEPTPRRVTDADQQILTVNLQ